MRFLWVFIFSSDYVYIFFCKWFSPSNKYYNIIIQNVNFLLNWVFYKIYGIKNYFRYLLYYCKFFYVWVKNCSVLQIYVKNNNFIFFEVLSDKIDLYWFFEFHTHSLLTTFFLYIIMISLYSGNTQCWKNWTEIYNECYYTKFLKKGWILDCIEWIR